MTKITGLKPKLWSDAIVGYGDQHYRYDSGREGEFFVTGFSPRKTSPSLHIKRLDDIHLPTLKKAN